jgi:prophage tail gpP-like protein
VPKLELLVEGKAYSGWEEASITRSIEAVCGAFRLDVSNQFVDLDDFLPIDNGTECELRLDGETVITGIVERVESRLALDGRVLTVSGRDKTLSLVKCSPAQSPNQYVNQTPEAILEAIIAPFGITANVTASLGNTYPLFAIEPTDKCIDVIRKICGTRGVLAYADRKGGLAIGNIATALEPVALAEGENIKGGTSTEDWSNSYSEVTVKGQSAGTKEANGRIRNAAVGKAFDPAIPYYWPLVTTAQTQVTSADCQQQAVWEIASRNGQALSVNLDVAGWRQAETGKLWDINQKVSVDSDSLYIDEALVIQSITYSLTLQGGTTASMTLIRPDGLLAEPMDDEIRKRKKGRKKKKKKKGKKGFDLTGTEFIVPQGG